MLQSWADIEMVRTFTTDLVIKAIKSCRNSKAFGPDKLSIFHLKHLGPRAIEYITTLFNLSATTCRIPAIWKSSLIIPIPKPGKDTSQGASYRPISLICPAAKVLESLFLPTINKYLIPAQDQHGFRREHSTTSDLLQSKQKSPTEILLPRLKTYIGSKSHINRSYLCELIGMKESSVNTRLGTDHHQLNMPQISSLFKHY